MPATNRQAKPATPAYVRAQEQVVAMIRANRLQAGARVPSERELAQRFGMSRMTVRQGIEHLVRAGVLQRDSTAGTRVADVSVMRMMDTRRAFSMTQMVSASGARPGSRLLQFAPGRADRAVAAALRIEPGAAIVTIRRLRTADEAPFCIETSILPSARVPDLVAEDLTRNASLYQTLRDRYHILPTDRDSEISVRPIAADDAALLGLEEAINVLIYRSVVRDADGVPIEHLTSVNHPQRVVFTTESAHILVG
jgi:GntR family transcriptional regulator